MANEEDLYLTISTTTPAETLQYLQDNYPHFFDIVMQEHFIPNTLDDVNYFLLYSYFEVKDDGKLECTYFKNKRDEKVNLPSKIIITKNNFYNAYTQKVWNELTLKEKIQVIYWHFLFKCYETNIHNARFRIVEPDDSLYCNQVLGMVLEEFSRTSLFVQIINGFDIENDFLTICMSLEHEFEHVKQYSARRQKIKQRDDLNIYEFDVLYGLNGELIFKDVDYSDAMYRISPVEISAENVAIKNYLKYLKANEQVFGKLEVERKEFKKFLKGYSQQWLRTPLSRIMRSNLPDSEKQIYKKSYKVMQDKDYLLKLCALDKVLKNKLDFATTEEEEDRLSKKIKTVKGLIQLYKKKQQKAPLVDNFFDELPLCEEEKNK